MSQVTNQIFYATLYHPIQAGSIDGTDTAPHDNAVYRALLASSTGLYDPTGDPKAEGDPYCTLFVGRLARHTTEETLKLVMSKFGKVKHIRVVRHIVTGASQGYAFVEFETEKEMLLAYEMAHYNVVDGSQIIVDYNRQQLMPGWIPRRLGGGLGGRKESGQLRFGGRDRPFRAPLRPIPQEQLTKLGIPLPPVGRYMSRFLLPPVPRRPDSSKETPHRHRTSQNDVLREAPHLESTSGDRWVTDRVSSRSPERRLKGGERSVDGIKPSSSSRHKRERHSVDDDRYSDHYNKRVRKPDSEKSRMDGKDYPSEAVDEKDYHERFETLESEKLHRERRHNSLEAADERDHHGQRYDDSGEHELRSTGYEGRRKSEYGQKGREGRRSSNRETADDEKRTAGYEINMSKHRHERRERKRSRSRESADNEIKSSGYEQGRKKSRHEEGKHERREYNRSHSKHRNRET